MKKYILGLVLCASLPLFAMDNKPTKTHSVNMNVTQSLHEHSEQHLARLHRGKTVWRGIAVLGAVGLLTGYYSLTLDPDGVKIGIYLGQILPSIYAHNWGSKESRSMNEYIRIAQSQSDILRAYLTYKKS